MPGHPPASALQISPLQLKILSQAAAKTKIPHREKIRYQIIVAAAAGVSNSQISRNLSISVETVRCWRRRWVANWAALTAFETGFADQPPRAHELLARMRKILSDAPRSGAPQGFTLSQQRQIQALACESPRKYGVEMTHWNREQLARVAIAEGIVEKIAPRTISKILKKTI